MKTIKEIAKEALLCQDACNLSGLVHSWSVWLPVIREHAESIGISPNHHPINQLMADKIHQLACGYQDTDYLKILPDIEAWAAE